MAKQASREVAAELISTLVNRKITHVELVGPVGDSEGYIIISTDGGFTIYADAPTVYSDDSGDVPAAF